MRWSEIDLDKKIWTVPANRMKAGREHRVPLSPRAVSILETSGKAQVGRFRFPGSDSRQAAVKYGDGNDAASNED